MAANHEKPYYDDVNIPYIVLLGFASAVITWFIILLVQGTYYAWSDSVTSGRYTLSASKDFYSSNSQIANQKQALVDSGISSAKSDALKEFAAASRKAEKKSAKHDANHHPEKHDDGKAEPTKHEEPTPPTKEEEEKPANPQKA